MSRGRVLFVVGFGLLAAVLSLLFSAPADGCGVVSYTPYRSYSYAPTYVDRVIVEKELIPVAVAVPVASVGYAPAVAAPPVAPAVQAPPPAMPAASPCASVQAELESLRREFAEFRRNVTLPQSTAPAGSAATPGAPAEKGVRPAASWQANCAACHGATADEDGRVGGKVFKFFDDKGGILADAPRDKMFRLAYTQRMPPPKNKKGVPTLTDEQVGQMGVDLDLADK